MRSPRAAKVAPPFPSNMAIGKRKHSRAVYLLPLTDDGAPDIQGGYIYLPSPTDPPYRIRFEIEGTSSICREGSLWVNIPAPGAPFVRETYTEHKYVLTI